MGAPFEGSPLQSPYAKRMSPAAAGVILDAFGKPTVPTDDPAWQAPTAAPLDPKSLQRTATTIYREIPIVTTGTSWTVTQVRASLGELVTGLFDQPAQLVDAVIGDSRVQAAMSSRTGGLLGREVDFAVPRKYRDSSAAQECADAFRDAWPEIGGERVFTEVECWATLLGFCPGQLLWNMDGEYATPQLSTWHPRYVYWHWLFRRYIAITMDGQVPIEPGDGHWFLHAPYGAYRGWMRGAVRAIAPWWLARNYALRDWARYSERHGMPIIIAKHPAAADNDPSVSSWIAGLSAIGQESTVTCPQAVDQQASYGLEYLETSDGAWQGFAELIGKCDGEITLALMSQNLTTEVKEGSYAAARVHADVRQSLLEADARALGWTIYTQIARPFAAMNFGDPNLAPSISWDVKPYEDDLTAAQTLLAFATAIKALKDSGIGVDKLDSFARRFGIDMGAARFLAVVATNEGKSGAELRASARGRSALKRAQSRTRRMVDAIAA